MPDKANNPRAEARATFFRPHDDLQVHRGHLPHWRQCGVMYFVTGRLADSMPQTKLQQWKEERQAWLRIHGIASVTKIDTLPEAKRHEFHRRFTRCWHDWLDAGYGECILRESELRQLFLHRLFKQAEERCELDAWVVMPNHFHALVIPIAAELGEIIQQWKGGSSFDINKALGRSGSVWQRESHDHIVRSEEQWRHYQRYIAENPSKAKLAGDEYSVGVGNVVWGSAESLLTEFRSC